MVPKRGTPLGVTGHILLIIKVLFSALIYLFFF